MGIAKQEAQINKLMRCTASLRPIAPMKAIGLCNSANITGSA